MLRLAGWLAVTVVVVVGLWQFAGMGWISALLLAVFIASTLLYWGSYLTKRIARAVLAIFIVASGVFFMVRLLPGNPVDVYIAKLTAEGVPYEDAAAQAAAFYSFDPGTPMWQQYLDYLWGLVNGDFGTTLSHIPVLEKIGHHLPWTLFSVGLALIISVAIGLLLGMVMAYRRGGLIDHSVSAIGSTLHAIPNYLLALIIVVIGGVQLRLFSLSDIRGTYTAGQEPGFSLVFLQDALYHASLPILAYVLTTVGTWALIMKASTTQALGEDYVMVARARGLGGGRIGAMYVGRNAVLPLVAQIATQAGFVVGGAIFVEIIFAYNGIGYALYNALNDRDYSLIQGLLLIITITVVFANLLADLSYGLLDPRIRTSGKEVDS
ncbi:ABC transporter permease [Stackebrandtia albiflava]|uniref:ABC transporter permease n=1 Tax=Stackebrandtia albiflava TaxID=406432 RepID=UPI001FCF1FFB|nr:ABC transporter permease [Stackebrandtia albiflava]